MLDKFAAFLGTSKGFYVVLALSLASNVMPPAIATVVLSVVAIILSGVIVVNDAHSKRISSERDVAMHKKLDGLIAGVDKADDRLQGIEPDEPKDGKR